MTAGWVLIVAVSTLSGKFIEKIELGPFATKNQCESITVSGFDRYKLNKICVTIDHWTGKSVDAGTTPD